MSETSEKPELKKRRRATTETRRELVQRLENPILSLQETAILLGVCRATVRLLSDESKLAHHRTPGGQRRFFYKDIKEFVHVHGPVKKKRRKP